jgi:hypothetical protein
MIEMRWIVEEREQPIPPADLMNWPLGKPYPVHIVSTKKLQYRQKIDVTVRAGMWPTDELLRTANMQWSEWRDVPEVVERDMGCP